jgi:chromosome segregation ATPase
MAKGVTQEQVNAAIDALVGAGERPTIERVRAALGTGSPNTLTRMLEVWWAALGDRLSIQRQKVAMPDAPAEVSTLASQLWELALGAARAEARVALQGERAQLEADRTQLAADRSQIQQAIQTHCQTVSAAQQAQSIAETRLVDAQQLAERHGQQLADVLRQRDALQTRSEQLTEEIAALGSRRQHQAAAATAQRESHALHVRATEDRSHAEVDRARQETKDLRAQLSALEREHHVRERQHDEARGSLIAAQREAASQRARSDALEQQLARLGELHAKLQATLAQVSGTAPTKRASQRQQTPAARKSRAKPAPPRLPARR